MTLLAASRVALDGRLAPLDLVSPGSELIALVGPNGSGKTSLLRALARVEGATGRVAVDGEDLDRASEARRRRLLSFLPASRDVVWPIAVRDTLRLGHRGVDEARVDTLIEEFGLGALHDRPIGRLSTGERARALLARALVSRPRLLLLDEPFANLDPYWVLRVLDLLGERARDGATVMVALHDLALIDRFDRLLLMTGGRVSGDGPPGVVKDDLGALFGIEAAPNGWRIARG